MSPFNTNGNVASGQNSLNVPIISSFEQYFSDNTQNNNTKSINNSYNNNNSSNIAYHNIRKLSDNSSKILSNTHQQNGITNLIETSKIATNMTSLPSTSNNTRDNLFEMPKLDNFMDVFSLCCSIAVIFGGLIPYIPQYLKIKQSMSNDGFSTYGMS